MTICIKYQSIALLLLISVDFYPQIYTCPRCSQRLKVLDCVKL